MKKSLPLKLLQLLEPYSLKYRELYDVDEEGQHIFKAVDKDPTSEFYFIIEDLKPRSDRGILVNYKPGNTDTTSSFRTWSSDNNFGEHFERWLNILRGYEEVHSFFEDPIINQYSKDYFDEFELVDENAYQLLSPKQILLLDNHLELIENKIQSIDPSNPEIPEIIEDVKELRRELSNKTRKQIVQKLAKIWAKITKQGAAFLKELLTEAKRQSIKEGIKVILDEGTKLIS